MPSVSSLTAKKSSTALLFSQVGTVATDERSGIHVLPCSGLKFLDAQGGGTGSDKEGVALDGDATCGEGDVGHAHAENLYGKELVRDVRTLVRQYPNREFQ